MAVATKKKRGRPKGSKNKKKATKKKKTSVRGRKRKEKQTYIPGTEPHSIAALDRIVENYVDVRDRRMELTENEVEMKRKLREQMKKEQLDKYECNGYQVIVEHGEDTVKVKKSRQKTQDDE